MAAQPRFTSLPFSPGNCTAATWLILASGPQMQVVFCTSRLIWLRRIFASSLLCLSTFQLRTKDSNVLGLMAKSQEKQTLAFRVTRWKAGLTQPSRLDMREEFVSIKSRRCRLVISTAFRLPWFTHYRQRHLKTDSSYLGKLLKETPTDVYLHFVNTLFCRGLSSL